MMGLPIYENVKNWRRDGRKIYAGKVRIAFFDHEIDAKLFQSLLQDWIKTNEPSDESTS